MNVYASDGFTARIETIEGGMVTAVKFAGNAAAYTVVSGNAKEGDWVSVTLKGKGGAVQGVEIRPITRGLFTSPDPYSEEKHGRGRGRRRHAGEAIDIEDDPTASGLHGVAGDLGIEPDDPREAFELESGLDGSRFFVRLTRPGYGFDLLRRTREVHRLKQRLAALGMNFHQDGDSIVWETDISNTVPPGSRGDRWTAVVHLSSWLGPNLPEWFRGQLMPWALSDMRKN